jgi:hypothetical protein
MDATTDFAEGQPLKRFAFILRLREGVAEAYEKAHREVWPEMREMLKRGGISEYSIFRRDNLLFLAFKAGTSTPPGEVLSYTYDSTQHLLTFSAAPNAATASRLLLTNAYERDRLVRQVLADGSTYTYVYSPENGNTIRAARVHGPTGRTFQISVGEDSSFVWEVDRPALPAHRSAHTASVSVGRPETGTAGG